MLLAMMPLSIQEAMQDEIFHESTHRFIRFDSLIKSTTIFILSSARGTTCQPNYSTPALKPLLRSYGRCSYISLGAKMTRDPHQLDVLEHEKSHQRGGVT